MDQRSERNPRIDLVRLVSGLVVERNVRQVQPGASWLPCDLALPCHGSRTNPCDNKSLFPSLSGANLLTGNSFFNSICFYQPREVNCPLRKSSLDLFPILQVAPSLLLPISNLLVWLLSWSLDLIIFIDQHSNLQDCVLRSLCFNWSSTFLLLSNNVT